MLLPSGKKRKRHKIATHKRKKRLRKKKHLGEFAEWGRQFVIIRNRKDGFDEFLDAFIEEAIESSGCYCGGGIKGDYSMDSSNVGRGGIKVRQNISILTQPSEIGLVIRTVFIKRS